MADIIITQEQLDEFAMDLDLLYDDYKCDDHQEEECDELQPWDYDYEDEANYEFKLDWINSSTTIGRDEEYRLLMLNCTFKGIKKLETKSLQDEIYHNIVR